MGPQTGCPQPAQFPYVQCSVQANLAAASQTTPYCKPAFYLWHKIPQVTQKTHFLGKTAPLAADLILP